MSNATAPTYETSTPRRIENAIDAMSLGSVLGIWAHPDDEAYMSSGLMALAAQAGSSVACVTATKGEHGTDDPIALPPERLAERRAAELRSALECLDVCEHHWLGYEDGQLSSADAEPAVCTITALIRTIAPDTIVTFGPDGMTGHIDHRVISDWVTQAWSDLDQPCRLLYAAASEEFLTRNADLHEQLHVFYDGFPVPYSAEEMAVEVVLDDPTLDRKLAALRAHDSQTARFVEAFGVERYRDWWSVESFREVR